MPAEPQFELLRFQRLSIEEALDCSRRFLLRMRERRSVRDLSTESVPFELIENAVATAASAPSGANQQPWTFVVIDDPDIKRAIRQAAEAEEKASYERRMSTAWLDALAPLGTDWHKPHLESAPYLIVVFAQSYGLVPTSETGESEKVKHYYVAESVGIAVGMLLCSLHLAGLATLTYTPSPMGFLNEILGRPANERPYVVIPVGYPAPDGRVPTITKKPLSEVLIKVSAHP